MFLASNVVISNNVIPNIYVTYLILLIVVAELQVSSVVATQLSNCNDVDSSVVLNCKS